MDRVTPTWVIGFFDDSHLLGVSVLVGLIRLVTAHTTHGCASPCILVRSYYNTFGFGIGLGLGLGIGLDLDPHLSILFNTHTHTHWAHTTVRPPLS